MKNKSLPHANKSLRVALYARFSTEDQGDQTYTSIDAQFERLREHAKTHGYTIAVELSDAAKSGTNLRRAGYKALVAIAETGSIDAVLITYMSRLGRGDTFVLARAKLAESGVKVETVCESYADDVGGYAAQVATRMMDGMYPIMVKGWTEAKMREMLSKGYACSAPAWGYLHVPAEDVAVVAGKRHPKKTVLHPDRAPLVLGAFETAQRNPHRPINAAAEYMRVETNEKWGIKRIRTLLTNERYLGIETWGQWKNESAHEAIVSQELFDAIQDILETDRPRDVRLGKSTVDVEMSEPLKPELIPNTYLLKGIFYCICGARMTPYWSRGRGGKKHCYYECLSARKYATPCPCKRVSAPEIHENVVGEMLRMARHPWRLRQTLAAAADLLPDRDQLMKDLVTARKTAQNHQKKIDRLSLSISLASETAARMLLKEMEIVISEKSEVETRIESLETQIEEHRQMRPTASHLAATLSYLAQVWDVARPEEREEIVSLFITRVEIVDTHHVSISMVSDWPETHLSHSETSFSQPETLFAGIPTESLQGNSDKNPPLPLEGTKNINQKEPSFEGFSPSGSSLVCDRGRSVRKNLSDSVAIRSRNRRSGKRLPDHILPRVRFRK
jgi:predicted site-specific integrase-resolvase